MIALGRSGTRALQIALAVLLAVCFLQAVWWIVEEALHTSAARDALVAAWTRDVAAAERLLAAGAGEDEVRALLPHLVVERGAVAIDPAELERLADERRSRLNRIGWEGTFFLVVLLGATFVIWQALRQGSELLRRQQSFLASVSHEFKSPLASLRLSADTLLLRRPGPDDAARLGGRMVADLERLDGMVTNLLETARLEEGEHALEVVDVRLAPALEPVLDDARRRLPAGVLLDAALPEGLGVRADPDALRIVVANLLSNAVKSVAAGGGGSVRLDARADGRDVVVEVADDGLGFEAREARKLFEKFYRSGDEMRRRTKGSGLGLYIADRLARMHGARIEAESPGPGRGATFRTRWPAA